MKSKNTEIQNILENSTAEERQDIYNLSKAALESDLAEELGVSSLADIRKKNGAQSMAFLIEMLPTIWKRLEEQKRYSSFTWLDVGPGAGYGASLLSTLHSGYTLGYKLNVSTIDIVSRFEKFIQFHSEDLNECIFGDIYNLHRGFDYVSASHVIEHVSQPEDFVLQLQKLTKKRVFILTPWKERPEHITRGHQNIFDESFIHRLGNPEYKLLDSVAWGAFMNPRYKMLLLDLPGLFDGSS